MLTQLCCHWKQRSYLSRVAGLSQEILVGGFMIVITTPTGRIGHEVLDNVLDSAEMIRVIARDPSRLARRCANASRSYRGRTTTSVSLPRRSRAPTACSGSCRRTPTRRASRATTWTSPGQRARPSRVRGSGESSASRPWAAGWPERRASDGRAGHGRTDREHWRQLPGAANALVHGEHAASGRDDQEPGDVLPRQFRRSQAPHLRHP